MGLARTKIKKACHCNVNIQFYSYVHKYKKNCKTDGL